VADVVDERSGEQLTRRKADVAGDRTGEAAGTAMAPNGGSGGAAIETSAGGGSLAASLAASGAASDAT
jgi:hypothetical protein